MPGGVGGGRREASPYPDPVFQGRVGSGVVPRSRQRRLNTPVGIGAEGMCAGFNHHYHVTLGSGVGCVGVENTPAKSHRRYAAREKADCFSGG
jgi:hypothetical protein